MKRRRIGLLGGSFNPAHDGHRSISLEALKRLRLDEVWWLVSPRNPLKDPATLASYRTRLQSAKQAARHPKIRVSGAEARFGTVYTVDTLSRLRRHHPDHDFVWLMGADNLLGFHRWRSWRIIAATSAIAVFDRKPYTHRALRSRMAEWAASARLDEFDARNIVPGSWVYLFGKLSPLSSTALRKTLGDEAFLTHNKDG